MITTIFLDFFLIRTNIGYILHLWQVPQLGEMLNCIWVVSFNLNFGITRDRIDVQQVKCPHLLCCGVDSNFQDHCIFLKLLQKYFNRSLRKVLDTSSREAKNFRRIIISDSFGAKKYVLKMRRK